MLLSIAAAALALAVDRPATLIGGYGATLGPPSVGAYVDGRAIYYPWQRPLGLELGAREGYYLSDRRMVGLINVMGRYSTPSGVYFRGGIAHAHETPWDVAMGHPVGSTLGAATGIRHRTGLEAGVGIDVGLPEKWLGDRFGLVLDLSVAGFPDKNGPPAYVMLQQEWSVDVGRKRPAEDRG